MKGGLNASSWSYFVFRLVDRFRIDILMASQTIKKHWNRREE